MWLPVALALATAAIAWSIQKAIAIFNTWTKNAKLAKAFPHTEQWSYIYGTLKPRDGEADVTDTFFRVFQESTERFKDVFSTFLGPMFLTFIVVVHPEAMQAVLKRSDGKAQSYEFFRPWLGDGLLLAKGEKWQRNRKLLTPAFHFGILKTYVSVHNEATDTLLGKLRDHCRSGVEYWDVSEDVGLASLEIILRCAFSSSTNCQLESDNDYVKAVHELSELGIRRFLSPWKRMNLLYSISSDGRRWSRALNIVHSHSRAIINARKKELASRQGSRNLSDSADQDIKQHTDFLDLLLAVKDVDGNSLPDEDIQAEADTFLFEGHDTAAAAMSWILYLCAKYPDHQQKLQNEIDAILSGRSSEHLTWSDLSELKDTTLFIKEAMRLCPPVPIIARTLEEDIELCGRHLQKGVQVEVVIYSMHHNRHVWGDDVEEFKPERFSPENIVKIHPYAYVPFSAGPRNCIGQSLAMNELKLIVARVLRRFVVKPHPTIIPKPVLMGILRTAPSHPIRLKLEERM